MHPLLPAGRDPVQRYLPRPLVRRSQLRVLRDFLHERAVLQGRHVYLFLPTGTDNVYFIRLCCSHGVCGYINRRITLRELYQNMPGRVEVLQREVRCNRVRCRHGGHEDDISCSRRVYRKTDLQIRPDALRGYLR